MRTSLKPDSSTQVHRHIEPCCHPEPLISSLSRDEARGTGGVDLKIAVYIQIQTPETNP